MGRPLLVIAPEPSVMRGHLRSRQVCPACGRRGRYALVDQGRGRRALVCECGGSVASSFEVVGYWNGQRYEIRHDRAGSRLLSIAQAEQALAAVQAEIEAGTFLPRVWSGPARGSLLWENYLAAYLAREHARCSRATWQKKRALARHLAWFNGRNIRDLRTGHVEDFMALPCLRLALGPKTLADLAGELRHIFAQAVRREEMAQAPTVPPVAVPERAIRWMTQAQQERAMAAISDPHKAIFTFLFTYGCRPGEACALDWDMVDLQAGTVILARTISRRRLAERTKTGRTNMLPIVGEWLPLVGRGLGGPVFRNPEARATDRRYTLDALHAIWQQALATAGLPSMPLKNGTRHSRAMQLMGQGVSLAVIGEVLGHTSQTHTRKYARADVAMKRGALTLGHPLAKGLNCDTKG